MPSASICRRMQRCKRLARANLAGLSFLLHAVVLAAGLSPSSVSGQTAETYAGLTIPRDHPRLWFTPSRLAQAKRYLASHPYAPRTDDAFGNALLYQLTGNPACARNAISRLMSFTISQHELTAVASDTYRWSDWVPVVFDWVYDRMTPAEISTFIARYNAYVAIMMRKEWGSPRMPWSNYYAAYWRNEFNWGIGSFYENPLEARRILDDALKTRWQHAFVPYARTGAAGGVPPEGTQYGRYMLEYPIIPLVSAANMGRNLLEEMDAYTAAAYYLIYATSPMPVSNGSSSFYQLFPFGDDEMSSGFPPSDDRHYNDFMTMLAGQIEQTPTAGYIRRWLASVGGTPSWYIAAVDKGGKPRSFNELPLDYYAAGLGHLYAKSSWSATAMSVQFRLATPPGRDHMHNDAGCFQILRAGYWLSRDAVGYADSIPGPSGAGQVPISDTLACNGLHVGGTGQSAKARGLPMVTRLESQPDYVFASVTLTDAYRSGDSRYDNRDVSSVVRDFIYVRPLDTLVALDRVSSTAASTPKTFVLHFPSAPTVGANTALGRNGTQCLRLFTLTPQGQSAPTYQVVNEAMQGQQRSTSPQFRLEETTSGQSETYLINVMQARDESAPDLTTSMAEDSAGFTITLNHPTRGSAALKMTKGTSSSGGSFSYAAAGRGLNTTPLTNRVQAIQVTSSGPVWSRSNASGPGQNAQP